MLPERFAINSAPKIAEREHAAQFIILEEYAKVHGPIVAEYVMPHPVLPV